MTFSNKAMQPLSGFGIQFNKNSFGLAPAQPLNVPAIPPNQACAYIWTLRKLSPRFIAISQLFYSLKTHFELELLELELDGSDALSEICYTIAEKKKYTPPQCLI